MARSLFQGARVALPPDVLSIIRATPCLAPLASVPAYATAGGTRPYAEYGYRTPEHIVLRYRIGDHGYNAFIVAHELGHIAHWTWWPNDTIRATRRAREDAANLVARAMISGTAAGWLPRAVRRVLRGR